MKQNNKIQNVLALVLTIVALMVGQTAWATEYITDVMLIGAYERSDYNTLMAKYTAEGWKQTNWVRPLRSPTHHSSHPQRLLYPSRTKDRN